MSDIDLDAQGQRPSRAMSLGEPAADLSGMIPAARGRSYRLAELAEMIGGEVVGDGSVLITDVAGIREAMPGDITFCADRRYDALLKETRASAVICSREKREAAIPIVVVDNAHLGFQRAVRIFRPHLLRPVPGVHETAVVSPEAAVGGDVAIGPHCVVEAGARIGHRAVLMSGCYIGHRAGVGDESYLHPRVVVREECVVGARCVLHPGVVIGGDGFGFAFDAGQYHKVPQVGNVVVGDDVEIGANSTIDRATIASTRVGDGTKIDNLVQIGHNVLIGRHCIIVAQVGIAGSAVVEDYVTIGGQAGLGDHIRIGKGAKVGARSGVTKSAQTGTVISGYPAMQHAGWQRLQALIHKLPALFQRTRDLEERVKHLEISRAENPHSSR